MNLVTPSVTMEKLPAPQPVPEGGSDPTNFFGRMKAEKVGSLPPVFVVFPLLLSRFVPDISRPAKDMPCHQVKTWVQADLQSVVFTFFTDLSPLPGRKHRLHLESAR
jgi:hypothetical protein